MSVADFKRVAEEEGGMKPGSQRKVRCKRGEGEGGTRKSDHTTSPLPPSPFSPDHSLPPRQLPPLSPDCLLPPLTAARGPSRRLRY